MTRDLATLYEIKTYRLNEQVKRNLKRFAGYIFQLNEEEKNKLIAKCDRFNSLKHSSSNPYAFNEYGTLMLASVLNSELAIEINRKIIKAFVELRKQIATYPQYELLLEKIKLIESQQETLALNQKIDNKLVSDKVAKLSGEVRQMSQILDEFQDNHLIIKRPDQEMGEIRGNGGIDIIN